MNAIDPLHLAPFQLTCGCSGQVSDGRGDQVGSRTGLAELVAQTVIRLDWSGHLAPQAAAPCPRSGARNSSRRQSVNNSSDCAEGKHKAADRSRADRLIG